MNRYSVGLNHSLEISTRYGTIFYRGFDLEQEPTGPLLKRLIEQKGLSQRKLAILSGVDRGYINSLISGRSGSITLRIARQLASALNESPEIFLKSIESINHQETSEEILERLKVSISSTVPIFGEFPVYAGGPMEPIDHVCVVRDRAKDRNLEGYIVRGDCLEPYIHDNDIIIVDRDARPDDGDIVACLVGDGVEVGRLRKIDHGLWMENNNGRFELEEGQVRAVVVELRRRLK